MTGKNVAIGVGVSPAHGGIRAVPHTDEDAAPWDDFVATTLSGTFLHTRRFLSYHGDRFRDVSLQLHDPRGLVGVFPAAVDRSDARCVVSHPGLTYGALLHAGGLRGERMAEALEAAQRHWRSAGFDTLRYKAVPHIYHKVPAEDDVHALFRQGARLYRCDLSCTVDLGRRLPPSDRRVRALKQARAQGVQVATGIDYAAPLWRVLENNLAERHGAKPVHSLAEIELLASRFPSEIEFVVGLQAGRVGAGVVLFRTQPVIHAQYIASDPTASRTRALDAVIEHCIATAGPCGARYFDFGISTEDEGRHLNAGLYQFKSEFGGGGAVHQFFEVDLRQWEAMRP